MKHHLLSRLAVVLFLIAGSVHAQSPTDRAREADILRLVEMTGSKKMAQDMYAMLGAHMKTAILERFPEGGSRSGADKSWSVSGRNLMLALMWTSWSTV